ncbi:MAG: hypothetical protein D5R97_08150 [Candidatus Syntrophonatronum acetioxidans]|uniref:DUF5362 domain-containing protein n=1 Tax=Candidatus Syntrophonatronum acetioxidans TaxID=1795816 RepID=A0A424YBD8_9FIRM|nr:MAG: hypothetical protein D5R97_08150 [Candidatus Syntrophonatronum acetioxidans]
MINEHKLTEMKNWAGFLGIMLIISGILSALSGLVMFIVGAIPGIITIILGLKLREAKKYAEEFLHSQDQEDLNSLITSLGSFFKIQGILIIIIAIFILLGFLLALIGGFIYTGYTTGY